MTNAKATRTAQTAQTTNPFQFTRDFSKLPLETKAQVRDVLSHMPDLLGQPRFKVDAGLLTDIGQACLSRLYSEYTLIGKMQDPNQSPRRAGSQA